MMRFYVVTNEVRRAEFMSEIKPGIYRNVKITDYHSGDGLSATGLCELMRSPLHYITSLKTPHKETPALKLGSATHCAILEPERFAREYIKAGNLDRRTKEGKAAWLEIEQSGKIVLTPEEYDKVTSMTLAIRNHEVASKLFSEGLAEHSIFWNENIYSLDSDISILCKSRPDYVKTLSDGYIIVDLKTAQDAETREFQRRAYYKYFYHIQAGHYLNGFENITGTKVLAYIYVVIENEPPYAINVFRASQDFLNAGRTKVRELYELYASCKKSDNWPSYSSEIKDLNLPKGV